MGETLITSISLLFSHLKMSSSQNRAGTMYETIPGSIMGNTRSGMMTTKKSFPSILMKLLKGNGDDNSSMPLPEDVVVEILGRLSPEHILICRMVCKRWMSLTSTPAFHLTPTPPVILLQHSAPNTDTKLYYLNLTHDKPRIVRFNTTRMQPSSRRCFYGGTCNGLVLLWRRETSDLPININGSLYFLPTSLKPCRNPRNCVMIFNIEKEEFDFKAHPHNYHCTRGHDKGSEDMWLLDLEGSLGFAHLCSTERSLCVWALEECATWKWIPRFKISINWHRSIMGTICALSGTQKGEMVMHYCYRRLFAVNLETRRIRKIDINIDVPTRLLTACTYARSLVDPSSLAVCI